MKDIVHQVSQIPGIAGVLAYGSDGCLLAHDFPSIYDEAMLRQLAETLASDTIIMRGFCEQSGTLDLKFAKGRVIARSFRGGMLVALSAANANVQLLGLAFTQATRRLESALEAARSAPARPAAAPAAPAAPARPVASGPVLPHAASILEGTKKALIRQMGPLGTMVFDSVYADWAAGATPTRKGLDDLLIRLAREFDEPAKQAAFIHDAKALLD